MSVNSNQVILSKNSSYTIPNSLLQQLSNTLSDVNINYSYKSSLIQNYNTLVLYGFDAINNMILNVLYTQIGERDFEPTFGSRALNLLFEPNDSIIPGQVEIELYDKLRYWLGGYLEIFLSGIICTPYYEQQVIELAFVYTERVSGIQNTFTTYLSNRGRLLRDDF